jgi:hypothetical protein
MKNYLSLVKFSHTVFALPFAMIGFTLGVAFIKSQEFGVSNKFLSLPDSSSDFYSSYQLGDGIVQRFNLSFLNSHPMIFKLYPCNYLYDNSTQCSDGVQSLY